MKRKVIKILLIIVFVIITLNLNPIYMNGFTDPTEDPGAWKPVAEQGDSIQYKTIVKSILGYINVIGIVVSVIVLIILGLKYLLGSIEEKAEYKKTMMGYLIGALMLFSTTTIANILYNIGLSIAQ